MLALRTWEPIRHKHRITQSTYDGDTEAPVSVESIEAYGNESELVPVAAATLMAAEDGENVPVCVAASRFTTRTCVLLATAVGSSVKPTVTLVGSI